MILVPVSTGELYDKISILEIKKEKGLEVDQELNLLYEISEKLENNVIIKYLREQLHVVNIQIWNNENDKRSCENDKRFDNEFVSFARAVYILNDQRAKIKRQINDITNSEITELKQHEKY